MGHHASSNTSSERFFVAFVLTRGSSDVLFVSVFTVFCCLRTKLAPNAHERRQTAKIEAFRPPKSNLGASAGPRIEPKRPSSSEKARAKYLWGLRQIKSQRERANFERENAPSASEERAGPRGLRRLLSESSNGCKFQNLKMM